MVLLPSIGDGEVFGFGGVDASAFVHSVCASSVEASAAGNGVRIPGFCDGACGGLKPLADSDRMARNPRR
jgi:hypothetical protein